MSNILRCLSIVVPIILVVPGCGIQGQGAYHNAGYIRGDVGTLTYRAVDQMMTSAPVVEQDSPLVVASILDAQNLEKSSALGNIVADMIRTRLVQSGYAISEIRLRNNLRLRENGGEFLLSRDPHAILPPQNFAAILTGTYTATPEKVYISLKLISASDTRIMAACDYVVPYAEVAALLQHPGT